MPSVVGRPDVIAIGSSTGGPQALFEVLAHLKGGVTQPILITQHMPATFTTILAEHITRQCGIVCGEAKDGEAITEGRAYVAPGDYHMLVVSRGNGYALSLTKDPPENFCRPAVDPMLRSVVRAYGRKVLTVILTGMGQDGLRGCQEVTAAGGVVIGQDEASSVVWGMPGAVATAGLCSAILPLKEIGPYIRKMASRTAA
jgi:two-component system chemotaxis response regulator CheB